MKVNPKLKEEVAAATRLFWEKGLSTGRDSGDISLRDPAAGFVYLDPRPNPMLEIPNWGVIKAEDIVVMDMDGNLVEDNGIKATVEAPMHLAIYKARPEINAIVHPHAVFSSAFAAAQKDIPMAVFEFNFAGGGGEVPCAKYAHAGTETLAENMLKVLGKNKKAALLANHGSVALGIDFSDAFNVAEYTEKMAQVAIYATMLGGVIGL